MSDFLKPKDLKDIIDEIMYLSLSDIIHISKMREYGETPKLEYLTYSPERDLERLVPIGLDGFVRIDRFMNFDYIVFIGSYGIGKFEDKTTAALAVDYFMSNRKFPLSKEDVEKMVAEMREKNNSMRISTQTWKEREEEKHRIYIGSHFE
jgi:hypothetical protein